jgi:hypothetical protein
MGRFGSLDSSSSFACSRKSHFKATRTSLTPGQFSAISATHLDSTFSSESAESTCHGLVRRWCVECVVGTYAEAEHNGVGIIVGQGAQTVEFFLAGRVPEGKFYVDIVDEDVVDIIF